MAFNLSLRKPKQKQLQLEEPESKFGPPVNIYNAGGVQLASPLLDADVLEIPLNKLNITYPINPPYAYANVYYDSDSKEMFYKVLEPGLTRDDELKMEQINAILHETINIDFKTLDEGGLTDYLRREVNNVIRKYRMRMDRPSYERLTYYVTREFVGYNRIDPILRDPNIEDISCDGPAIPLYIFHRHFENLKTNVIFRNADELDSFIIKLAQRCQRHVSIAEPLLDGSLPDGSRVQLSLGKEVTMHGSTFTIRKFREDPLTPPDMMTFGTFSASMLALMWFFMEKGVSILIAGGTASGKTTTLNCLCLFIRPEAKIVSIEDTAELNVAHQNWIPAVTRAGFGPISPSGKRMGEVDMFDLLKASLRQRPDYIVVGEVRGKEAYTLFQAIATGHAAMGTIHADSPQGVVHRLESEPINCPRILIKNLDIVLLQARVRLRGKITRRITDIVEVVDLDPSTKEVITNTLYEWNPFEDTFRFTGRSYLLERLEKEKGMSMEEILKEIERRKQIISWMHNNQIRFYKDVAEIIAEYYRDPDSVLGKIEATV
ncbi:MAG: type II/IV secretion system ATPase subunit [Theionarchaea archaeon]|nr:type II/IV secretion system ATPase subunit [Theionarchaea archaeon]MBU7039095.1 type II/IV secretion system ATPase subunit [Theionarchaea archaeon]